MLNVEVGFFCLLLFCNVVVVIQSQLLVKVDEADFDDFEQFVELLIFKLFHFDNFVQLSPEYLLPIFTQVNSCLMALLGQMLLMLNYLTLMTTQTGNPTNNLPHKIKISTLIFNTISTTILFLRSIFIILNRLDILFILTGVIIQISK